MAKEFLLYPTVSYLNNENYLESFQDKYQEFVKENSHPCQEGQKYQVKYYATVEAVIEKPTTSIGSLIDYTIWTDEHVLSYLNSNKAYVWLLRVYKLKEPVMIGRTRAMVLANTDKPIALDGVPVFSYSDFTKIKNRLDI